MEEHQNSFYYPEIILPSGGSNILRNPWNRSILSSSTSPPRGHCLSAILSTRITSYNVMTRTLSWLKL